MTKPEKDELLLALSQRICWLETGDPVLRSTDVHNQMRGANAERKVQLARMLRPLGTKGMEQILLLERLIEKITKTRVTDG